MDNIDEVMEIIKSSELEDAKLFDENYCRILTETPKDKDTSRYITLRSLARRRIVELSV